MSVADAVRALLEESSVDPVLGATALELARQLDDPGNSATSKSMCAKALNETMTALRALTPPKLEDDEVERARKRRAARLGGVSESGSGPSS